MTSVSVSGVACFFSGIVSMAEAVIVIVWYFVGLASRVHSQKTCLGTVCGGACTIGPFCNERR